MKIFLDTNVLLDWLLDRQDTFGNEATAIIEAAENNLIEAYISAGTVYTVAYVLEKSGKKGEALRSAMTRLLNLLKVKATDTQPYLAACLRNMKDLEDAFQYEIALYGLKMDYFVTANLKDFATQDQKELPVVTPAQMLDYIRKL